MIIPLLITAFFLTGSTLLIVSACLLNKRKSEQHRVAIPSCEYRHARARIASGIRMRASEGQMN